jgi:sugar phosphate isomerase/epimerase
LDFGCGNWSAAPHLKLDTLLDAATARDDFLAALAAHGLAISALNCSGNPLHPGEQGRAHRAVTSRPIRPAGPLGVSRVALMSGGPGCPGDANANSITTTWPREAAGVLDWQWSEQVIPYWQGLVREACRLFSGNDPMLIRVQARTGNLGLNRCSPIGADG